MVDYITAALNRVATKVYLGIVSKNICLCGAVGINSATPLFVCGCSCSEPDQEAGPD